MNSDGSRPSPSGKNRPAEALERHSRQFGWTSRMRPSRKRSQRATRSSAAALVECAKEATVLGVKSGAKVRLCARHSGPSTMSKPFAEALPEDASLRCVLAIIGGVSSQNPANRRRIVDHRDRAENGRTQRGWAIRNAPWSRSRSDSCAGPAWRQGTERRIARDWRRRAQARRLSKT